MIYQLPSGKIIQLTVDQYLNLTDRDLQDFEASGAGDYPTSAFQGSVIKKTGKRDKKSDELTDEDKTVEFNHEDQEGEFRQRIEVPDEELPHYPEESAPLDEED